MDLTEAEDIKKRWQDYTELYKNDLHNPGNHDGVITHLKPDILECELKWALGSITTNKASGADRIPVELFQILKVDAVIVLQSIRQQIKKTQQWPQDWKTQFSFQLQRKAMPKNVQSTSQLHTSHNLDSILKSRDITWPTKVHLIKAMVFPLVMYGYDNWTIKKAGHQRIDAFKLWSWRRLLRVPWTAQRSNQSILKEISPEYSLEGLMLKLKLQ